MTLFLPLWPRIRQVYVYDDNKLPLLSLKMSLSFVVGLLRTHSPSGILLIVQCIIRNNLEGKFVILGLCFIMTRLKPKSGSKKSKTTSKANKGFSDEKARQF